MVQEVVVALFVAVAALYALWRWMPAGWRRALAERVASGTQRTGLVDEARAQRLAASLGTVRGCGGCDGCGGGSCGSAAARRSDGAPGVSSNQAR